MMVRGWLVALCLLVLLSSVRLSSAALGNIRPKLPMGLHTKYFDAALKVTENMKTKGLGSLFGNNRIAQRLTRRGASYSVDITQMHSLDGPQSRVYWRVGGDTVQTKEKVRLVPTEANRKGFMANEYPLEKDSVEIEVQVKLSGSDNFGGDGLAVWFIPKDSFESAMENMVDMEDNRPSVYGMDMDNLEAIGLVIDTYDNDGNEPKNVIGVLNTLEGKTKSNWQMSNHLDYKDDFMQTPGPRRTARQTCSMAVRNTEEPVKLLIKKKADSLDLYVTDGYGGDYQHCLQVGLTEQSSFKGMHMVLTAATGMATDNVDVSKVHTRILVEREQGYDTKVEVKQRPNPVLAAIWLVFKYLFLGAVIVGACFLVFRFVQMMRKKKKMGSRGTGLIA